MSHYRLWAFWHGGGYSRDVAGVMCVPCHGRWAQLQQGDGIEGTFTRDRLYLFWDRLKFYTQLPFSQPPI